MMIKTMFRMLAPVLLLLGTAGVANAGMMSFTLNNEISGSGGTLTGPIVVTLDDEGSPGTVKITVDWTAGSGDPGQYLQSVLLNFEPTTDLAGLSLAFTAAGSTAPAHIGFNTGAENFRADGQGYLDVEIVWDESASGDRFNGGELFMGVITGSNITAGSFDHLSSGAKGGQCAAARARGLGDDNQNSGWFDCDGEFDVPEPGTLALLGLGLLGLARRRRVVA